MGLGTGVQGWRRGHRAGDKGVDRGTGTRTQGWGQGYCVGDKSKRLRIGISGWGEGYRPEDRDIVLGTRPWGWVQRMWDWRQGNGDGNSSMDLET